MWHGTHSSPRFCIFWIFVLIVQSGYAENLTWKPLGKETHYELCIHDDKLSLSTQPVVFYAAFYNREGEVYVQLPAGKVQTDSSILFESVYAYSGIKEVWIISSTTPFTELAYKTELRLRREGFKIQKKYKANFGNKLRIPLMKGNPDINQSIRFKNSTNSTLDQVTEEIIGLLHKEQIRRDSVYTNELLHLIDEEILTYYNIPFLDDSEINLIENFEKQLIALAGAFPFEDNEEVLNSMFKLVQFAKQNHVVSADDILRIEDEGLRDSIIQFKTLYSKFVKNPQLDSSYYFKTRAQVLLEQLGIQEKINLMDLYEVKRKLDSTEIILYFFVAGEAVKCFVIGNEDAAVYDLCSISEIDDFFSDVSVINHQQMADKYDDELLVRIWENLATTFPEHTQRIFISGIYYLNYLDLGSIKINKQPLFLSYQFAKIFSLEFLNEKNSINQGFGLNMCGDISYSPLLKSVTILNNNEFINRLPQLYGTKLEMDYFARTYSDRIDTLRGTIREQDFQDFFERGTNEVFFFSGHSISFISDDSTNYIPSALLLSDVNDNLTIETFKKDIPNPDDGVYTYSELMNLSFNPNYNLVFLSSCQSSLGSLQLNFKPSSLSSVFRLKSGAHVISSTTLVSVDFAYDFAKEFFQYLELESDQDLISIFNQTKRTLYHKYQSTGNFVLSL